MRKGFSSLFIQTFIITRSKQASTSRRQLFHHTPVSFNKARGENWGNKKRRILASNYVKAMADRGDKAALELEPLRKSVKEQGKSDIRMNATKSYSYL